MRCEIRAFGLRGPERTAEEGQAAEHSNNQEGSRRHGLDGTVARTRTPWFRELKPLAWRRRPNKQTRIASEGNRMKPTSMFFLASAFASLLLGTAIAEDKAPDRKVDGTTVTSSHDPAVKVTFPATAQY